MKRLIFALLVFSMLLAACAPKSDSATADFDLADWDSVLAAADGQTVTWYMWGGSDSINAYVDNFYGVALKERYNVTLNRVPVADAADYINQVLSEKEAGVENGAVDLMWINGENFFTLKQAEMLYADWAQAIPNSAFVDWGNPAINRDFGEPVEDLESPWSSAQFQFIYDSARMDADSLPRSYADLATWACEHPGRFTYIAPGPGAFQGTRFVKGALFEISGDAAQWGTVDEALWDEWSPKVWDYFNKFKTCLWREGETYPKDEYELHSLFANNEVDFSITQAIVGAGALIDEGLVPTTSRAFVFDNYMIGDFNYVAIPSNASNKAAALVLANLILDPEFQAAQVLPENGFGLGFGIDVTRVTDPDQVAVLEDALANLGEAATPAEDMAKSLVGDAASPYQSMVEEGWRENVLIGQ
ncbi:MAG: ABC transporter substrate-binding protein [Anaerolineae bacterium]|jgi:putative spermidine/putrescine transport system substrate-binding protein|nr:ABC transporter substrate-binding protein [Anaerolineae bacterium]MBT7070917.1 ABC transporter substrate-binding protein [Anaerolineae bacterium]MBT7991621.1 ABC transporter substrate-binding protein [Anaerolineae bacterium]